MKKNEIREIYAKKPAELELQIKALASEFKKASLEMRMGKQKNTNLLGRIKKDIARIKTALKIMEIQKT